MGRLKRKVALITGGAKGIGKQTAKLFAHNSSIVIVSDVLFNEGQKTINSIQEQGGKAKFFYHDVSKEEQWRDLVEEVLSCYGSIDVLINNAGVVNPAGLLETDNTLWDSIMNINAKGVFLGMKHVVPAMLEKRSGAIVNLSSMWGIVGAGSALAYQASKGAVRTMTKSVATEYAAKGIRVNSVHPGIIATDMVINDTPFKIREKIIANTPMGRMGTPEEVANLLLFLASEESSYITGGEFLIDGGFTAL